MRSCHGLLRESLVDGIVEPLTAYSSPLDGARPTAPRPSGRGLIIEPVVNPSSRARRSRPQGSERGRRRSTRPPHEDRSGRRREADRAPTGSACGLVLQRAELAKAHGLGAALKCRSGPMHCCRVASDPQSMHSPSPANLGRPARLQFSGAGLWILVALVCGAGALLATGQPLGIRWALLVFGVAFLTLARGSAQDARRGSTSQPPARDE